MPSCLTSPLLVGANELAEGDWPFSYRHCSRNFVGRGIDHRNGVAVQVRYVNESAGWVHRHTIRNALQQHGHSDSLGGSVDDGNRTLSVVFPKMTVLCVFVT